MDENGLYNMLIQFNPKYSQDLNNLYDIGGVFER